jgi:undecaprenyl-diphosphatase
MLEGLVQGLTEFLPVSSKSHLVFANFFMGIRLSDSDTVFFDVMLHWGTLVAVLAFFYQDVLALLRGAGQLIVHPKQAWAENTQSRLFVYLLLGTIPAGLVYIPLKHFLEAAFENVPGTAVMLLVTACMLFWISRRRSGDRTLRSMTWRDAVLIGCCQAAALLPGISRSGSTITGGLFRGLDRDTAPRFSFLLAIPVILAAGLLKIKDAATLGISPSLSLPTLAAGFIVAAVSGYFAIGWLLRVVQRGRLDIFGYYCAVVGIGMLAFWTLLVPKIDANSIMVKTGRETYTVNRTTDEIGNLELGERVRFAVNVTPGLVAIAQVSAEIPAPAGSPFSVTAGAKFPPAAGGRTFLSEEYQLRPMGDRYAPSAAGDLRDVWVVVRNRWGITNQVRVRLRVVPESLQRCTG